MAANMKHVNRFDFLARYL